MIELADESLIVRLAIVVGLGALAFTVVFLLGAFASRGVVTRRTRRRNHVEQTWAPYILSGLREDPGPPPRLRRRDAPTVIAQWLRLSTPLQGAGADRLQHLARRSGLNAAAQRVLERGRVQEQLVSAVFLGRQRDLRSVKALVDLTDDRQLVVRAEAARALVSIDPAAGVRLTAPLLARWSDCHPALAVAVLDRAPAQLAATAVAAEATNAQDPAVQARLMEVLAAFPSAPAAAAARTLLETRSDPELVSRCLSVLRELRDPADSALVRRYVHHSTPFVRVQAVTALGRLQVPGDEWCLYAALSDRDWWVRHRAAEGLTAWRRLPAATLAFMRAVHPDPYGRDALEQAASEGPGR